MTSTLSHRENDVLDHLKDRPELQSYFLRKAKGLRWFDELRRRGYFDPKNNPPPKEADPPGYFSVPYWPSLAYLESTAEELLNPAARSYVNRFLNIISQVTLSSSVAAQDNYHTWYSFAKILATIPVDALREEHVALCDRWLNTRFDNSLVAEELGRRLLPRLIEREQSHDLALRLLHLLTELRETETHRWSGRQLAFRFDGWRAARIFEPIARQIGSRLGIRGLELLEGRLCEAIAGDDDRDRLSFVWRPAIEDHEQNSLREDESENILVSVLRDACHGLSESDYESTKKYVLRLLAGESVILRRIAIYLANALYPRAWEAIEITIDARFFAGEYQHELYGLLSKRYSQFPESLKERVLTVIESLTSGPVDDPELTEKREAYQRLEWLTGLKDAGDSQARELYDRYRSLIGEEPRHPDFPSYMESTSGKERSPIGAEDVLSLDIDTLVHHLDAFEDETGWGKPSRRGLAEALGEAVKSDSARFAGHLPRFVSLDYVYTYEMLRGLRGALEEGRFSGWSELLGFCKGLLARPGFWDRQPPGTAALSARAEWVSTEVARLCRDALRASALGAPESQFGQIEEIIGLILGNEPSADPERLQEPFTTAINSPYGVATEGLLELARRRAQLEDERTGNHDEMWAMVSPLFDQQLERGCHEFWSICGAYILLILYLSRGWVEENFDRLFPKEDEQRWLCAMDGYAHVSTVHESVYGRLRDGGHLLRALDAERLRREARRRVVQNVAVAYVAGWEECADPAGLIEALIERRQESELNELIWFLWTMRKQHGVQARHAALRLWRHLLDRLGGREGKEAILGTLSLLASYVEQLDGPSKELMITVAPHVTHRNADSFIRALARLGQEAPIDAGEVFLAMLEKSCPDYPSEEIISLIERVWHGGGEGRVLGERIFDEYFRREHLWLQDTRQRLTQESAGE